MNERITIIIKLVKFYSNVLLRASRVTSKSPINTWSNSRRSGKLFKIDLLDDSGEIRMTAFNQQVDELYDFVKVGISRILFCQLCFELLLNFAVFYLLRRLDVSTRFEISVWKKQTRSLSCWKMTMNWLPLKIPSLLAVRTPVIFPLCRSILWKLQILSRLKKTRLLVSKFQID